MGQRIFTWQPCMQFLKSICTAANLYPNGNPYPNPNLSTSTTPVSGHEGGSYHQLLRAKVIIIGQCVDTYYITINFGLGTSSCCADNFSELGAWLPCI